MDEAMARAKAAAAAERDVPEGYELVAEANPAWRLVSGKACRAGASRHRPACGRPSVAEFNRTWPPQPDRPPRYWAYCEQHLYRQWIEDGRIMRWILREISDEGNGHG